MAKGAGSHADHLGYFVFEQTLWGRGIASKALALFLQEIARRYGLKTVGALIFAGNYPSIRVLEKNGFHLEEEFEEEGRLSRYYEKRL